MDLISIHVFFQFWCPQHSYPSLLFLLKSVILTPVCYYYSSLFITVIYIILFPLFTPHAETFIYQNHFICVNNNDRVVFCWFRSGNKEYIVSTLLRAVSSGWRHARLPAYDLQTSRLGFFLLSSPPNIIHLEYAEVRIGVHAAGVTHVLVRT